ncbi:MAG: hypothetical protein PVF65_05995 [Sphingomonadales bacterium]|jgi:hypothetical protein
MAFLGNPFGKKQKTQEFRRFSPQQESVLNQLLGGAQQQLPSGLDFLQNILGQSPEAMQAYEAPALRQFQEQILPMIAERFTGGYGSGSQRSSAFGQQLGQQGAALAEKLQAQRAGLGFDALSQLQNLLGYGLTPRTERVISPGRPGLAQGISGALGQGLGFGLGGKLGNFLSGYSNF